jgi:hypothetical protein
MRENFQGKNSWNRYEFKSLKDGRGWWNSQENEEEEEESV